MKLFCVRHGETNHNLAGRIQGQSNSQLSPLGVRQSLAVADALVGQPIDAVISSPLERALESARPIAERFNLQVQVDPRLAEIHAGIFQGHTWEEIDERFPVEAKSWRNQDPDYRIPGGESRREVMTRVRGAFEAFREAGYRQAVIMAHGGSLSAAFKSLLEIPAERSPFSLANASISTLVWDKDVKLLTLNDTGHLRHVTTNGSEM